jgi:hypothetical protein
LRKERGERSKEVEEEMGEEKEEKGYGREKEIGRDMSMKRKEMGREREKERGKRNVKKKVGKTRRRCENCRQVIKSPD